MLVKSDRVKIICFTPEMAGNLYINSQDYEMKQFLPDEVYENAEQAEAVIHKIIDFYKSDEGPFVYAVINEDDENVGHVEICKIKDGYEIGYHIASRYAGRGYATEAVKAFTPVMMDRLNLNHIYGITLDENVASARVLEKCGFSLSYKGKGLYQGKERDVRKYVYKKAD
ncbi:MAG: GNAT family N-acetyltransferase [Clostridia bacterium]|nr:GNAT family N-acetyltransferase [Clostridia bacterium]MBR5265977.1 GNAT family N-acetyltransferase [Clostridia bacterium]